MSRHNLSIAIIGAVIALGVTALGYGIFTLATNLPGVEVKAKDNSCAEPTMLVKTNPCGAVTENDSGVKLCQPVLELWQACIHPEQLLQTQMQ